MTTSSAGAVLDAQGQPLDRILLTGLTATGYHGVLEHERANGQAFSADVALYCDTRRAAREDDIEATVDYGHVAQAVVDILAGPPADLVETVAERIAARVLAYTSVQAVDVTVHKPQAPIAVPFDDVVITIRRDRLRVPAVPAPIESAAAQAAPVLSVPVREAPAPQAEVFPAPVDATSYATVSEPDGYAAPVPADDSQAELPVEPAPLHDRMDEHPEDFIEVVLALGGNLGDIQETLREAVTDLDRIPGLEITEVSPLSRSAAIGDLEQPDYLNAVLLARTRLSARELLHACAKVEKAHGRVRGERWAPRTLDIDIIVYGALTDVADDLELPHPRAHERAFVLEPWSQVDPDAVLPGLGGGPVTTLAATAPDRAGIRWLALDWLTEPAPSTGMIPAQPSAEAPSAPEPFAPSAPEPFAPVEPAPQFAEAAEPYGTSEAYAPPVPEAYASPEPFAPVEPAPPFAEGVEAYTPEAFGPGAEPEVLPPPVFAPVDQPSGFAPVERQPVFAPMDAPVSPPTPVATPAVPASTEPPVSFGHPPAFPPAEQIFPTRTSPDAAAPETFDADAQPSFPFAPVEAPAGPGSETGGTLAPFAPTGVPQDNSAPATPFAPIGSGPVELPPLTESESDDTPASAKWEFPSDER